MATPHRSTSRVTAQEPQVCRTGVLQVVMFHQYPEELLRGWLRKQNIRDEQVEFCVLPPPARA